MTRKLLVLDLDETLIYATEQPLEREAAFIVGPYHVYKRPYVDQFLDSMAASYDIAVWTSASAAYARAIVNGLCDTACLQFVWAGDRCTSTYDDDQSQFVSAKRLQKVRRFGYRMDAVVVVDDSAEKHRSNYGNLVRVRPWTGSPEDDELMRLSAYLDLLRHEPDIRAVEKRGWRSRTPSLD